MPKYFKASDAFVREIASSYHIYNLLTNKDSESMSVVKSVAQNHYEVTKNTDSDRAYYVLAGELILNGQKCQPGDVIYIPRGEEYQFEGTFEAVIINSPAFNPKHDRTSISGPKAEERK